MGFIYFGHPISTYDTDLETRLIEAIQKKFPDKRIENPNHPVHEERYQVWKEETGNGMEYYFQNILPYMKMGVFLAFEDGMFGAGVYKEAEFLYKQGSLVYEIARDGKITALELDEERRLSIEETRSRLQKS